MIRKNKKHKIKHKGFSLIELLVVIAIIGVLSALLMGAIRKGIQSAQRIRAASHMRQIIIAYNQYTSDWGGDHRSITLPEDGTAHDWIKVLAEMGYLNEAFMVAFDLDPLVKKYSAAGFFLHFFGTIPRQIWDKANASFVDGFRNTPLSLCFVSNLDSKAFDFGAPLLWFRGLNSSGTWNPVEGTDGSGCDGGVCGTEGGFVGFVTGRVQWYEHYLWKRYLNENEDTSNIWESLNPDAVVVDWQGPVSGGGTSSTPSAPSEPEGPDEGSEEPSDPDEPGGSDEGPEEPENPDEPTEPEDPKPEGLITVEDMMDFFKTGEGAWGSAQLDILYAMSNQNGSSNIPGAIYKLFNDYYGQTEITLKTCAQLVNGSFVPAYERIYEKFGELVHGNTSDINAALGYGGYGDSVIDIQKAKSLAAAYKATVDQSIAPYLEDSTYNTYLELLTTELVNPKENHNYYSDERIVGMDYSDPAVTLAFAHVAIDMINYMLAEL